ncbi:MAG TPA: MoxR family ATPase [Chthoniobacteraceae bacterium]|jgi:MoxR-like ATPase
MTEQPNLEAKVQQFKTSFGRIRDEMGRMMVGQQEIVEGVLAAFFAGGHVLLEGVPGLGKTMLVRTLADAVNLKFSRVQFTPDLMPADIVGTNIINEDEHGRKAFQFQAGPIFANIVLADEINRATPKTQSALLEAMQEQHVTVGGAQHPLELPFLVLATQNPLEMEGTYPLPEAQLDRFFFKLRVKYPTAEDLHTILDRTTSNDAPAISKVLGSAAEVLEMRQVVRQVPLAREIQSHAIDLVLCTHPEDKHASPLAKKYVRYGASPRGAQALILAGKIYALLDNRYHVARADIDRAALAALRHRIILNFEGEAEGISTDAVINEILQLNAA